ncbi:FtsB family cell division protein [Aneurinibacillus uraniidurans]|uniref:FtsB family cell division protein n=1 Tax=Aneurinibacillus uraniidurans TaxID=2966586 RepID=UPI002348FB9C|nr:septum formation initiator family protein [Aneurinibacillus sp. B1]WCN37780.1 septum formation initiator family protein [Aneurinibacillus sp. B1]
MQKPQSTPQNYGRKRRMRVLQIFVVLFLGWAGYTYYEQSQELAEKQRSFADLQRQADETKQKQKELELQVKRLNDSQYIAELARQQLFLSKQGEVIFITPEQNKKAQ